jgi:hypothetical protein
LREGLDYDDAGLPAPYGKTRAAQAKLERITERRDADDGDRHTGQKAELHESPAEAALASYGDHHGRCAERDLIQRHRHSV